MSEDDCELVRELVGEGECEGKCVVNVDAKDVRIKSEIKIIELYGVGNHHAINEDAINDCAITSDRNKLVEKVCVICLEVYDGEKRACVPHSKHIVAKCDCAYFVHSSCFQKWVQTRPTNSVNCLVCSSEGVLVLSYVERISIVLKSRRCRNLLVSMTRMFCWGCVLMLLWEISCFIENRENDVYGNGRYYEDDVYKDDVYEDDVYEDDVYEDDVYEKNVYEDDISASNSRPQEGGGFLI
jgi:hypothetical protein